MKTVEEVVAEAQVEIHASYVAVAKMAESKATYEAAKAQLEYETTKALSQRVQNYKRPCMTLLAQITRVERDGKVTYTATYAGLTVEGDTPEIAFDNFDQVWTQGE